MTELFLKQFSGMAPVNGQRHPNPGALSAQKAAVRGRKENNMDPAKILLDEELQTAFQFLAECLLRRCSLRQNPAIT